MKKAALIYMIIISSFPGCSNSVEAVSILINPKGSKIATRFYPPAQFERVNVSSNSFAFYLRGLRLKSWGSKVLYFNGTVKTAGNVYLSVVKMDIGKRDLQQCADAVMRLRAEYFFQQKKYKKIHFNFLSDGKPRYFTDYAKGNLSYKKFRKYMARIFAYANSRSLHDELIAVADVNSMKIGDVFIQKGKPFGHAVIVVDMAVNKKTGEKVYLLAQSYMPAQDIQVLKNPMNGLISPWYKLNENTIYTPEWTFQPTDLRGFID